MPFFSQFFLDPPFAVPFIVGVLGVNILILLVFVVAAATFFKRVALSREESEIVRKKAEEEAERIIGRARHEALVTVEKAGTKVDAMFQEIERANREAQKRMEEQRMKFLHGEAERVQRGTDGLLRGYEEAGVVAKSAWRKAIEEALRALSQDASEAFSHFRKTLEEEAVRFRSVSETQFLEWQRGVQHEVEAYKKEAMKKVDQSMYRIISLVSKEVLGKALDLEGQQRLVMRALEEAKKEGFFRE